MATSAERNLPLISPHPPRLSEMHDRLVAIESSGIFSNGGPVVSGFEADIVVRMFSGEGAALAVSNATVGLMIAIRQAALERGRPDGLAILPSFTFAATAHAAQWAGLTPLLCDSDRATWALSAEAEERALAQYGDRVAVIVPYAPFGGGIDLERYRWLSERHGVGVVVDAASSLGTLDRDGRGFGTGMPFATVFSMHATKSFATAEGGLVYSGDPGRIACLRSMGNFGFAGSRVAVRPGLNAKLPEVLGLLAAAKLETFEPLAAHRAALADAYRARLSRFTLQQTHGRRICLQFMPVLLPADLADARDGIVRRLADEGIGTGTYFSPHLNQQPYFREQAICEVTPVADDIAARVLVLPITDDMSAEDVGRVCDALERACAAARVPQPVQPKREPLRFRTIVIGGGPAGIALLDSATKQGNLPALAQGLAIIERSASLGAGELPSYAITSDSTAETFLTAARDNVHPELAALVDHPAGREITRHIGALGVPLSRTGAFLNELGNRLAGLVEAHGGTVLARHEVRAAHRLDSGEWLVCVRDLESGAVRNCVAENLVLATGGYQSGTDIAAATVAGATLGTIAGDRLMLGDDLLRLGGVDRLRERLAGTVAPRVAILGGSTSAMAAAALLLRQAPPIAFGAGGLTLLHREQIRPFYPSAKAALADGFTDFGPDDICPLSGFVYRLAGFRLEARELALRMLGIGGREPDPRLATHRITGEDDAAVRDLLDRADVIVAALGYRPRALPLFDSRGNRLALSASAPGRPRMVDQQCRVIDAFGHPLPGVYGIGLAAGFVPEGRLGGEKSFRGKANGLWLWQNDVGQLIVDQILGKAAVRQAA